MRIRQLLLLAVLSSGCTGNTKPEPVIAESPGVTAATVAAVDTSELVVVIRPTVLGFFRPPLDSADAMDGGYTEGVAHIEFAVVDALECLGRDSADARMIIDTLVRIQAGERLDTLRFPMADSMPYGVYLLSPTQPPHLVRAYGPSQVMSASLAATPGFFGRPACRSK